MVKHVTQAVSIERVINNTVRLLHALMMMCNEDSEVYADADITLEDWHLCKAAVVQLWQAEQDRRLSDALNR